MTGNTRTFGTTSRGETVQAIEISSDRLRATILTFGATLQDLRLTGTPWPLTLGGQSVAAYEGGMRYFGAIVGPVANRIAGARATLRGRVLTFEANERGLTAIHGGSDGIGQRVWDIDGISENSVTLRCTLADGLGGYPGNRVITATFSIDGAALSLEMRATTDAPTLVNLANHSYWNLDAAMDTSGQVLTVAADRYLAVDEDKIPLGPPRDVTGTEFDLRRGRALDNISRYDHNFCTAERVTPMRIVGSLRGSKGVVMTISTTAPGLQVYDGARMNSGAFIGHTGQPYGPFGGVALETQLWPDAPNRPDFPSTELLPGQTYEHGLGLAFDREDRA